MNVAVKRKRTVVVVGVHEFFIDTRTYYSVATDMWSGKPLRCFTRKELETYRQVSVCMGRNMSVNRDKFMYIMAYNTVITENA